MGTQRNGGGGAPASVSAYETLRSRILTGELAEGERLVEQSLAEELGISRTPVREAIRRLIHEGFVEKGTGYRTRVASFPADELSQIFELRRRLECYAASRAALLASEEQIERLRTLTTRMEAHTPPDGDEDLRIISTCNADFHRTIYEAACSPRLMALMASAVDVGVVARTYHAYSPEDLIRSARHHREIVDAIAARAPDWAESVMSSHVLAAGRSAVRG